VLASVFSEGAGERRTRLARERQRAFEHGLRSVLFADAERRSALAAERLPDFGVEACVVAALARPDASGNDARLILGFGPRGRLTDETPTRLGMLPTHPLFANTGRTLVALPLTTSGQALGLTVVALSKAPDAELEALREFLSSVLDTLRQAGP
jgi:hypothetical protein